VRFENFFVAALTAAGVLVALAFTFVGVKVVRAVLK